MKLKYIFFVRAYLGDVIAVILIYTFILSIFQVKIKPALITGIFVFSIIIEFLQFFKTADLLGFKEGSIPISSSGIHFLG